uniref:Uncharacterized protein n=1 Tax=viral metagenome TaxID=1070528 RepID=A0A6C0C9A4_9ZZZZ
MEQVIESVPLPLETFDDSDVPSLTTYLQYAWLGYVGGEIDDESNR